MDPKISDANAGDALLAQAEALINGNLSGSNVAPEPTPPPPNVKMAPDGQTPTSEIAQPQVKVSGRAPKPQTEVEASEPKPASAEPESPGAAEPATPAEEPQSSGWVRAKALQSQLIESQRQIKELQAQVEAKQQVQGFTAEQIAADPMAVLNAVQGSMAILGEQLEGKKESKPLEQKPKVDPELQARLARLEAADAAAMRQRVEGMYQQTLASDEFKLLRTNPNAVSEMLDFAVAYADEAPFGKTESGMPLTPEGAPLTPDWVAGHIQTAWREQLSSLSQHEAIREIFGATGESTAQPGQQPALPAAPKAKTQKQPVVAAAPRSNGAPEPDDDEEGTLWEELSAAAALVEPGAWGEDS